MADFSSLKKAWQESHNEYQELTIRLDNFVDNFLKDVFQAAKASGIETNSSSKELFSESRVVTFAFSYQISQSASNSMTIPIKVAQVSRGRYEISSGDQSTEVTTPQEASQFLVDLLTEFQNQRAEYFAGRGPAPITLH